jgi:hypothetical protein
MLLKLLNEENRKDELNLYSVSCTELENVHYGRV